MVNPVSSKPVQQTYINNSKISEKPHELNKTSINPFKNTENLNISNTPISEIKNENVFDKKNNETIIKVPQLKENDAFTVDGPLIFDGTAFCKKFNSDILQLNLNIKATNAFGDTGFVLKEGKINIDFNLEKESSDQYKLTIKDNNNNGQSIIQNNLKVVQDSEKVRIFQDEQEITIQSSEPGKFTIATNLAPVSFDFYKK